MADDVDPEVDALFDLPVDAFVAARNALAKARRVAGDRRQADAAEAAEAARVAAHEVADAGGRDPLEGRPPADHAVTRARG